MASRAIFIVPAFVAAGLASLWARGPDDGARSAGPVLPIAALAWAQTHCDQSLAARAGTPRVQTEDLLRIAALYDATRLSNGADVACTNATRDASSVVAVGDVRANSNLISLFAALR
ncbi:MAG: hypothetical protein ABL897_03060 [Hyphomicrobium sp.]